jgi:G3E family GTPase
MTRDSLKTKLPITIVTGFLGAGKTTLIGRLVRHPGMNRVAVVINEIGEIGLDHDLISNASESVSLLANGCLCCSVRTDLQETIRELYNDRRAGRIPDFDRIVLETTGLADPAPVIQTLSTDSLIETQFRFDGLVTLVDAATGVNSLKAHEEAIKQVSLADKILITKTDLVEEKLTKALAKTLFELNPNAPQQRLLHGNVHPNDIINLGLSSRHGSEAYRRLFGPKLNENEELKTYLGFSKIRHPSGIQTHTIYFDEPFIWESFTAALELLTGLRGPDLLRVKGIVNVAGKPTVIQGVQHIFHPAIELDDWPSEDRRSRIVFIARKLRLDSIRSLFEASRSLQEG